MMRLCFTLLLYAAADTLLPLCRAVGFAAAACYMMILRYCRCFDLSPLRAIFYYADAADDTYKARRCCRYYARFSVFAAIFFATLRRHA